MTEEFKSFFKVVGGNEGSKCKYNIRLDTYGCGCQHDCSYCYAKSLLDFRGLWNPRAPKAASLAAIERRIKRISKGTIVRLGGMTDCLQPIEAQRGITRATIAMLNRAGIDYLIVTKSHLIGEDKYLSILDPQLAHVQVSVTATDDATALKYERCSLSSKRLRALQNVQASGIDCALRLSPYIPDLINIDTIAACNFKKIQVEFLRVNHWVERWFGSLTDLSAYTLKQGAYRHLPLTDKIGYAMRLKNAMPGTAFSVCEDEDEAYAYWRDHFNPNRNDCCNLR